MAFELGGWNGGGYRMDWADKTGGRGWLVMGHV